MTYLCYVNVEIRDGVAYGTTPGCGCCSTENKLNADDLEDFAKSLEEMAQHIREMKDQLK